MTSICNISYILQIDHRNEHITQRITKKNNLFPIAKIKLEILALLKNSSSQTI